jgi:hypothetical protein
MNPIEQARRCSVALMTFHTLIQTLTSKVGQLTVSSTLGGGTQQPILLGAGRNTLIGATPCDLVHAVTKSTVLFSQGGHPIVQQ